MDPLFKHLFIFIIIFLSGINSKAQNSKSNDSIPQSNGKISGIVIDNDNALPVDAVTVTVSDAKDSVRLEGTETNSRGLFSVGVPFGKYKLQFSMIDYGTVTVNGVNVSPGRPEVFLDTIKIKHGITTTEEIDVTAEKNVIQITPEKKIFNVSQSILKSNGSATDVLRNVPTVSVDNDGNISIKGSQGVRVLIDGRPVFSSIASVLDGIPASSVESIEIISNPSAKYEAEGDTGIINIILKKNSDFGINGSLVLSSGTKDKYNASANLNAKNKKLNIYGNYSFQLSNFGLTGTSLRTNDINNVVSNLDQYSKGDFRNKSNLIKGGIDYNFTDRQTLGFNSTLNWRKRNRNETITNNLYDASNVLSLSSITNSDNSETGTEFNAVLDFNSKSKSPGRTFSAEASFARSTEETPISLVNQYLIIDYVPANIPDGQTRTVQNEKRNVLNLQGDYVHPFKKDSKLEAGFKSTYRFNDNDFFSTHVDTTTNSWVIDYGLNNRFKYTEFINALYATYSNKIGNLGYLAGLRTELTHSSGQQTVENQNFTRNYIDFFPSASLTQKLGKTNELELTYSRRINRPRAGWLNPFGENTDPYNLRTGNPNLNPEYIDSYELSHLKYFTGSVVTSSVFLRDTHGLISRLKTSIDSVTTQTTFVNLSNAYSYGFELIGSSQTPRWLNLTGSFSYYNIKINGDNLETQLSNSGHSWYTKLLATVDLWSGLEVQMAYNYQARKPTVDGYIDPLQSFDIAVNTQLMKKKLEVGMRVSDAFNIQENKAFQSGEGFTQNVTTKRDSRFLYLTLTYRFGSVLQKEKGKNKKPKDDSAPEDN